MLRTVPVIYYCYVSISTYAVMIIIIKMWILSIWNSARIFVDSINTFSPKEKRNTKNEIEAGRRVVVGVEG